MEGGLNVWLDSEQVKFGDAILTRIAEGLEKADVLLFLISRNSGESPWCRKEYEVLLRREVITGQTVVIPVLLDSSPVPILLQDKRHVRLSDLEDLIASLVSGEVPTETNQKPFALDLPPTLLNGLTLLLLLDQFPIGVWGRSLASLGAAYGHPEDPGSITVSTWCADALMSLQGDGRVPEIELFTKYVHERRNQESGAVGMRRQIGSGPFKDYTIVENRRHTAIASQYLYRHCHSLDLALQGLRYVMTSQTPRGAWGAVAEPRDESADPLTTGYVLSVLREFERADLLGAVSVADREIFLSRYWKSGLLWLYGKLLSSDGWWPYRDETRKYCYTCDVLWAVPEFWMEDPDYEKAHEDLVTRLFEIWEKNGAGIPSGPDLRTAHLQTTAQYASAIWRCRVRYPELNEAVQKKFAANLEPILVDGDSDAGGWSLTLNHLMHSLDLRRKVDVPLDLWRQVADVITRSRERELSPHSECAGLPHWVHTLAKEKVLSVQVDPQ